jgi:hypothetical protein
MESNTRLHLHVVVVAVEEIPITAMRGRSWMHSCTCATGGGGRSKKRRADELPEQIAAAA